MKTIDQLFAPLDWTTLQSTTLVPLPEEAHLLALLQRLHQNFTSKREQLHHYWTDPALVSAYTLFYLPTNFYKLKELYHSLPDPQRRALYQSQFIDIGCGPGTYLFAHLHSAATETDGPVETAPLVAIDHSALMRQQFAQIHQRLSSSPPTTILKSASGVPTAPGLRTCCFGNSINEMGSKSFFNYLDDLTPDFILIIGLGTPENFSTLLQIQQRLHERGKVTLFPCLNPTAPCPLIQNSEQWCHQVAMLPGSEQELHRLIQLLKIDRRSLPFSAWLFGPPEFAKPAQENHGRVLRYDGHKGPFAHLQICTPEHQIRQIQIPVKDCKKRFLKSLRPGVLLDKKVTLGPFKS